MHQGASFYIGNPDLHVRQSVLADRSNLQIANNIIARKISQLTIADPSKIEITKGRIQRLRFLKGGLSLLG